MSKKPVARPRPDGPLDREALFCGLMDTYGPRVLRYIQSITRDLEDAEDVRQQVFLEAYRDLGNGLANDPTSWLFGIARHRALDKVKARNRWSWRFKNDATDEPIDPAPPAAERAHDLKIIKRFVKYCLGKLAVPTREAVVLRYQQGMRFEEIAAMTGDQAGTLQRRVARALPVLQKCVALKMKGGL